MEDLNPVPPLWEAPALDQSSWEDMLNDLLQDPQPEAVGATSLESVDAELRGLVDSCVRDFSGLGDEAPESEGWWASVPPDQVWEQIVPHDLVDAFIGGEEEDINLPGLSSEVSSPDEGDAFVKDEPKACLEVSDGGVSSPVSCNSNRAEQDCAPSSTSGGEDGNGSAFRLHSPVLTSCSDHGAASPDAGCDSSDVGAVGRSCDNFAEQYKRRSDGTPAETDEDAKRQSRLMRNRESAVQSRLRKKSYVKELEAKCRAIESQMSMLHQTVAFTSAQNAALREELAHYRNLKGNGSKSGVMEPAALPSDSLPSESPSRHTTTLFPSVKSELVAFLYHVLLLTLLLVPHPKPSATSEGRPPSKARSVRRNVFLTPIQIERHSQVADPLRNRLCSSNKRRKREKVLRNDLIWRRSCNGSMISILKPRDALAEKSSSCMRRCKISSSRRSSRGPFKRSQYSSLA
ncbi:unnamed protein product [Calypogeia fissa]